MMRHVRLPLVLLVAAGLPVLLGTPSFFPFLGPRRSPRADP